MAIITQGHQVQVMPTYSPLDPSRVAYNPQAFSQGALSSIEIIDQLQKQKAFLDAQAELAATRQGRLGATNAQNLATIQLAPEKNLADIALAQNAAALAPGQRELGMQQNSSALADLALKQQLRQFTDSTAMTRAQAENATAPAEGQLRVLQTDNALANEPLKNQFGVAELVQKFNALDSDKNMSDAQKLANIRNTIAEAQAREATARKEDRIEPKKADPIKELDDIQMQIQRLKNEPVLNPGADNLGKPMPYLQYQGQTRAPDGSVAQQSTSHWYNPLSYGDKAPVPLNPAAEKVANQIAILEARRDALTAAIGAPAAAPATPSAAPKTNSSGAKAITTQAEFNALKPGDPFIWNGKQGVKTK